MKNTMYTVCGLILFASLVGCNNAVKSFIDGAGRAPASQLPLEQVDGSGSVKISPGYVSASSATISMKANITATNQLVTGTGVSARLSLHQYPSK